MSRVRLDADEWYNRRYKHYGDASALWENRESLDKYIKRLAELMAEDGDESAIKSIAENPEYSIPCIPTPQHPTNHMTKREREQIFNKFGGRCAYCGCELTKGWHVDEIQPVIRKRKWVAAHWDDKTKPLCNDEDYDNPKFRQWVEGKWVADGCERPENYNAENQYPACASCNINKHSMDLESFRNGIAAFMKHLNEISTQYKIAKRYGLVQETNMPVIFYFETLANPTT